MRILFILIFALCPFLVFSADAVQGTVLPTPTSTTPAAVSSPPATSSNTTASATASESIGQVIWTKGQVSATLPNQAKRALSRRAPIYKEDTLESDKGGTAQINFTDGSLLAIAENTKLLLEKYNYNKEKPSEDSYVMNLAKGGLRTVTGEIKKGNPEGYKAKTPIATLSAAGTEYSVLVKANNDTLLAVKQGKIIATNKAGKSITLGAFDQRFAMISSANQEINVLKNMPQELKSLDVMKLEMKNINKQTPKGGGGGSGGFCVGK